MKPTENSSLNEQAAECLLALEIGAADPQTRLRWRGWLAESPEHRRAFETCRDLWNAARGLSISRPTALELANDPYDGAQPVAALRPGIEASPADPIRRGPQLSRGSWMGLAAASLLVGAVVAVEYRTADGPTPAPVVYDTGRGEEKQLTLPDGSAIVMGPEAHLEVLMLARERTFKLTSGEAIFTAAHDAARPFRVYAGAGWIEDIGTAFDVRSDPGNVTVTVIQGAVEVGTGAQAGRNGVRLMRDEQMSFGATRGAIRHVDAGLATAWRDGQLAYIDQPLEKVVADLQRYSMKDIVVQDPSVGALHYTGTVSIGELDHWAAGLARVYPVQVQVAGDRLLLAAKRQDR